MLVDLQNFRLPAPDDLRCPSIGAQIVGSCITQGFQLLPGDAAAHPTLAVQQQRLSLVFDVARQSLLNFIERNVDSTDQMPGVVLFGIANVNYQSAVLEQSLCFLRGGLPEVLQKKKDREGGHNYDDE